MVIEPLNPSAGFDIAAVWDRSWPYFVRNGDIFVGWTSRYGTIAALKQFNPARYAPLTWGVNSAVDDGITFDIAAQVGALFKENGPASPTHGLKVKRVFEAGFSQDGGFTFTQADVFNAIDRMPDEGPVYDGYVPGGTTGPSNIDFGLTPAGALPPGDPRQHMQPRDVPVIQINTETEVMLAGQRRAAAPCAPNRGVEHGLDHARRFRQRPRRAENPVCGRAGCRLHANRLHCAPDRVFGVLHPVWLQHAAEPGHAFVAVPQSRPVREPGGPGQQPSGPGRILAQARRPGSDRAGSAV